MPTVNLDRKTVNKLLGKEIDTDKLKDRISMLGTDLDSIDDNKINVEIFPNRPDLLSEQGFARALSSFMGIKTGLINYNVKKSKYRVIVDKSVNDIRPFTACAIIKNLQLDEHKIEQIIQMQEKLHITYGRNRSKTAIGIYPLDKIKLPIYYTAKNPNDILFIPLDSSTAMNGNEILENHSKGIEFSHLLKDKNKFPIFIDSKDQILSMPPIINSDKVGKVTIETKDVFIECSGFNYEYLSVCLNMIVTALADMGGQIFSMEIEYPKEKFISPNLKPTEMKLDLNYVNKILGFNIEKEKVIKLLEKMGHGYSKGKVLIPCYRADILHQIDLIEDIAIAYGYENIPEEIPNVATIGKESNNAIFIKKISEIIIGLGLIECKHYHLSNKKNQTELMNQNLDLIEIQNPVNEEYNVLNYYLLPSLLEILKNNKQREYPQKIFSIGTVFSKNENNETGIEERNNICCLICSNDSNYTKIRQVLDYVMKLLNAKHNINDGNESYFINGRSGEIFLKGEKIGVIGEVSPQVLTHFELLYPVASFEIDIDKLIEVLK
jgi:phenylalanyl-tRNA synthetase beta chain